MTTSPPASTSDDFTGPKNNPSQNQPGSTAGQAASTINQPTNGKSNPGRRLQNPLSNFASYTYQLSLYMITPDAYDGFVQSGGTNINVFNNQGQGVNERGGAYLIAQSGGINNSASARAPGFNLDYYIDDLDLTTIPPNTSTASTAGGTDLTFKIIEPYGFSFISNLTRTSNFIREYMASIGASATQNPSKQFFILGIRFYGYDDNGKPLTGAENFGGTLDPNASGNGSVFNKFIPILIRELKFKLDGKSTTYFIRAAAIIDQGLSTMRGFTKQSIKVSGPTVKECLVGEKGLIAALNLFQQQALANKGIEYASTYKIEFDGPEAVAIGDASVVTPAQINEYSFGMSPSDVKTTTDSNELASFTASPNVFAEEIPFAKDMPIIKCIETIITRSTYLTDAMKKLNANKKQPENNSLNTINNSGRIDIAWFSTTPILTNPRWDTKQKIWVYDITYRIRKFETPIVLTPYANPGTVYYGPHKIYDYWLTGNNNEVISYEQEFNNAYFQNILAGAAEGLQSVEASDTDDLPMVVGTAAGGTKTGSVNGGQNLDYQNTYLTTLIDTRGTVNAKINILGDPDFINQGELESVNRLFSAFYGNDGFSVAYGGGQTFVEINFYEGQDYDDSSGLFKINEKIAFYQQRNVEDIVNGLSYQVVKVYSKFNQGKFTQTLDLKLNMFAFANKPGDGQARTSQEAAPTTGVTADGQTTAGDGLLNDKPINPGVVVAPVNDSPDVPNTEPFADDAPPPFYDDDYSRGGRDFPGDGPFGP